MTTCEPHRAKMIVSLGTVALVFAASAASASTPLGLPPVPSPADNPTTPAKIELGKRLFEDKRFSKTGDVACATCHDPKKAFTDSPLPTSKGIRGLRGTRNAPTVLNAAYFPSQFWDGRSPSLEDQSQHPFVNPIEMGLDDHTAIIAVINEDATYPAQFEKAFGKGPISIDHVKKAIGAFERTLVSGNSAFDRFYFGGETRALTRAQKRGFELFLNKGRCVSCHVIEQTSALFTDGRFHNIGVGINRIQKDIPGLAVAFLKTKRTMEQVDKEVLADKRSSELGRLAVSRSFDDIGAFKTPTLRNVALTAPYMHDGSLKTLREVVVHYNNGGALTKREKINDFISGGIRPLALSNREINDLVKFMEALTSPEIAKAYRKSRRGRRR